MNSKWLTVCACYSKNRGNNKKRYSRKLHKYLMAKKLKWWDGTESNRRHEDFQSSALPTELPSQLLQKVWEAKEDKYHNHQIESTNIPFDLVSELYLITKAADIILFWYNSLGTKVRVI